MLGDRLKDYRKMKGLSQQRLADTLGVSLPAISQWENNKSKPTYKVITHLADIFDLEIVDIIGELKESDFRKERETNWTNEKVENEFIRYKDNGNDITDKGIRTNYPTLRTQIISRFGSYKSFLETQGIIYADIKMYNTWSKDKILEEFEKVTTAKEDLNVNNIRKNHNKLLGAIEREYGNYKNFIKEIGLDYNQIKIYQEWDKEKIVKRFKKYEKNNTDLRESVLQKKDSSLYTQIIRRYGKYKNFIETIGYNYDDIRGNIEWTDEKINDEFKKYVSKGKDLKASTMNREHTTLYNSIKRKYKDYAIFLESKGYDYNSIRGNTEWTDEKVREKYLKLTETHGNVLSFTGLSLKDRKLYTQIRKRFKSYKVFLQSLGVSEDEIYRIIRFDQEIGHSFESLVKEMFEKLNLNYHYQYRDFESIRPDFYNPENKEIIDVKLSFYTGFKSYTPEKYLKYCEKLTLIYLRGEPFCYDIENLFLVPIDQYYPLLHKNGLGDLVLEFEQLKNLLA